MTASAAESDLQATNGRDGSFSLWSSAFNEGFHCDAGAVAEAQTTFVAPSGLERWPRGASLTVLEVAVGTGTNTAALIAAVQSRELELGWWGLELDPRPLRLALEATAFRNAWPSPVLAELVELERGPTLLWGDARARLADLPAELVGACDLIWLDAFSPRRCPQLWTQEFLWGLARYLAPGGRLVSYGSAAAFRSSLRACGLHLAAIRRAPGVASAPGKTIPEGEGELLAARRPGRWSGGTVASRCPLPREDALRPLSAMEEEHLQTRAAAPYRDPEGGATAAEILAERSQRQLRDPRPSTSAWRRRWGLNKVGLDR